MADETEKTQKVDAAMEEASSSPDDEQKPAAMDLGEAKVGEETVTSKPDSPTAAAAAAAAASTSVKCTKCGKKWARKG